MLIVFDFTLLEFRFLMGVSFVVEEVWCRMGIMFSCYLSKRYNFVEFVIRVGIQLVR